MHGIVTDLGGGIDVESAVGAGSDVHRLPAVAELRRGAGAAGRGAAPRQRRDLLLVDDEEALVRLGEEMIAELGYEPVGFTSSVAALEAFRAEPAALRRRDHRRVDARDDRLGAGRARFARSGADIPIVLMSGYVTTALSARARDAGVAEVLAKPLVARDIARSLASALRPAPLRAPWGAVKLRDNAARVQDPGERIPWRLAGSRF